MSVLGGRIGVDLGGTKIHGVVLAEDGSFATSVRVPTPQGDYAGTVDALVRVAESLDPQALLNVGVGTPGSWVAEAKVMHNCNSTCLNGKPLLDDLRVRLGDRVRIANDANCFALSEVHGGAAADARVVFGAILGTGVGGGIVIDARPLAGINGIAGEWGHNAMPDFADTCGDGIESRLTARPCYCGRANCVETFLSGPGLALTHRQLWGIDMTVEAIYAAAAPGDDAGDLADPAALNLETQNLRDRCRTTLACYCRMLARGLGQVVNLLDPDIIVLGGGLSNMAGIYRPLNLLLRQEVFTSRYVTEVVAPRHGDSSGVRGAAWLWDA